MNHRIIGITASVFIIVFLCRESIHRRLRRSFTFISLDYIDDPDGHIQQCNILCHEHSCKREYIQSQARYFLSCGDTADLSGYPCTRHRNGTFREALIQRYFVGKQASKHYGFKPKLLLFRMQW